MANNIPITELTSGTLLNGEWQGTGVFDILMQAVNSNVSSQFTKGRLVGNDYANVYLGSMQAVLQQSIEFLLRKDLVYWQIQVAQIEADIAREKLELAKQELAAQYADRIIKDKEAAKLGLDNVVKQSEESRILDPLFVYKPRYKDTP